MLLGLGIDLVDIDRFAKSAARPEDDFLSRFLTPTEVALCRREQPPNQSAASLFAAKEAFSKALGTGIYGTFSFHDVEIRGGLKNPTVHLSGRAQELAEERGVTKIHLSITVDEELAAAVVVLE